ncbi:MAG: AccI family restriction endonuclease [Armatimonadetes bacterium]|nr:AccI family restriction endonuclease [Armatimonadota bacterium]
MIRSSPAESTFERVLAVSQENLRFELRGQQPVPWADFLLNPRRLRGSDFLMRWSQGVWSEERIVQAINDTSRYYALPYGPSSTAPEDDIREFELYFERLDKAGLGRVKRPDLLVFRTENLGTVRSVVDELGGEKELPFIPEDDGRMRQLLSASVLALECENSLWRAASMPDYGAELRPQTRLDGHPGLKKSAVVPTLIIKEEDRAPLREWQSRTQVDIHIWHVFYDLAFGIALQTAEDLIESGRIEPIVQTFQAPGGAVTKKTIYKIYYQHAYRVGQSQDEPALVADYVQDKNGHILPYVRFQGGSMALDEDALTALDKAAARADEQ